MDCSNEIAFCSGFAIAVGLYTTCCPQLAEIVVMAPTQNSNRNNLPASQYNSSRTKLSERDVNTNHSNRDYESLRNRNYDSSRTPPEDIHFRHTTKQQEQMGECQRIKHIQGQSFQQSRIKSIKMAIKLANIRYSIR